MPDPNGVATPAEVAAAVEQWRQNQCDLLARLGPDGDVEGDVAMQLAVFAEMEHLRRTVHAQAAAIRQLAGLAVAGRTGELVSLAARLGGIPECPICDKPPLIEGA